MIVTTRARKVLQLLEREERMLRSMIISRANRLGRLTDLEAPEFIIAIELRMLEEAIEALFRQREYDPTKDERVTNEEI